MKQYLNGLFTVVTKRFFGSFWLIKMLQLRTERYSVDQLRRFQLRKMKKIISHAYKTVPYYRRLFNRLGLAPSDFKTLSDITKLPILTKAEINEAGEELFSRKYPSIITRVATTGGTTGIPTRIARDVFSISNEHAFVRRQWTFAGASLWQKCAFLTAREIRKPGRFNSRYYYYDPFMRELVLSTYHLSEESVPDYVALIKKHRITVLNGYPSAVSFMARVCEKLGIDLKLNAVLTTSETLQEEMRRDIERVFGCKVFDYFGSAERVCYIQTCEEGSYHALPEYGYTELIPEEGGTPGACRVISTGFWNMAMPLLRYDMGDLVIPEHSPCSCGRNYPRFSRIIGRSGEVITSPSGIVLTVTIVIHIFYMIGKKVDLLEIQIVQDRPDHVVFNIVPAKPLGKEDFCAIEATIAEYLPTDLHYEVREVAALQKTSSGKVRSIISTLQQGRL